MAGTIETRRIAILGCGTLGSALAGGLLRQGLDPSRLVLTERTPEQVDALKTHFPGVEATTDNVAASRVADVVVLSLKPQHLGRIILEEGLSDPLEDTLVVSVAAGVRLDQLRGWLPRSRLVRAMPNTPARVGEGMTILARGHDVSDADLAFVQDIFRAVGACLELEPKHMDAVTSLNGSGPAFVYVLLEAVADGGVMLGLPRDVALQIAAQVFRGAGTMVRDTGLHPMALRDEVTTPGGCTIAGLLTMEDGRIRSVVARAIEEAARVAARLGEQEPSDT